MKAGRGLPALVAMLAAGALSAPPAHAGSYDVYSCKVGSAFYGNNAWTAVNNAGGGDPSFSAPDVTCAAPGDPLIAVLRAANFGKGVSSQLLFSSPVDTRVIDYTMQLRHRYSVTGSANPAGGVYRNNSTFTMAVFGSYAFSLTGEYDPGVVTYVSAPPVTIGELAVPSTRRSLCRSPTAPERCCPTSPRPACSRCMPAAGAALPMSAGWRPGACRSWS